MRDLTRIQRYTSKLTSAKTYPVALVSVNFMFDDNLGFLIRTAGCFGAHHVASIGAKPERKIVRAKSGHLSDLVNQMYFKNTNEFLEHARNIDANIISLELTDDSVELTPSTFISNGKFTYIVVGNEETGVPAEIIHASDLVVHINMPGVGWCLNTSQTANIGLYEWTKLTEQLSVNYDKINYNLLDKKFETTRL